MKRTPGKPSYDSVYDDSKNYLGHDTYLEHVFVSHDGCQQGPLLEGYELVILVRNEFRYDGSEINQCVEHITQRRSRALWKGPIIMFREKKNPWESEPNGIEDLDVSGIGPAINYFAQYAAQTGHV